MNRCGFTYLCRMISGMCLGLIVSCGSPTPESQQPRSIAPSRHGEPQIYSDPKKFFKITPPQDWRIEEAAQDPRGKVAFFSPNSVAQIRVLAKAVDLTDYDSLLNDLQAREKELGISPNVEMISFKGIPAVKRVATVTVSNTTRKFLWIDFLTGKISHNIQYSSTPADFEKKYELVLKSIDTYEPLPRPGEVTEEEIKKHSAAKWLRLAQLAHQRGDTRNALELLEEGLKIDPQNRDLKDLKSQIQRK